MPTQTKRSYHPTSAESAFLALWLSIFLVSLGSAVGWLLVDIPPRHQLLRLEGAPTNGEFHTGTTGRSQAAVLSFDLVGRQLSLGRWVGAVKGMKQAALALERKENVAVLTSPQRLPYWSRELMVWELSTAKSTLVHYEDTARTYRRSGWIVIAVTLLLSPGIPYLYYWHRRLRRQAILPSDD